MSKAEANDLCTKIEKAEILLRNTKSKNTLQSVEHRKPLHKSDESRVILRRKIFDELIHFDRLDDDDEIRLGSGGAKPKGSARKDGVAVIVTGLPASGKSSICSKLADAIGAHIIDSDFAKRKIPEFNDEFGASIVHDESSLITYGGAKEYAEEYNLYEYCIAQKFNIVIPKIGPSPNDIRKLRDALMGRDYVIHLVLVSLDRQEACRRAMRRYISTGRYVPLSLVFDVYGNEPLLTYYRVREDKEWATTLKMTTEFFRESGPLLVHINGASPAAGFCKERIPS